MRRSHRSTALLVVAVVIVATGPGRAADPPGTSSTAWRVELKSADGWGKRAAVFVTSDGAVGTPADRPGETDRRCAAVDLPDADRADLARGLAAIPPAIPYGSRLSMTRSLDGYHHHLVVRDRGGLRRFSFEAEVLEPPRLAPPPRWLTDLAELLEPWQAVAATCADPALPGTDSGGG